MKIAKEIALAQQNQGDVDSSTSFTSFDSEAEAAALQPGLGGQLRLLP